MSADVEADVPVPGLFQALVRIVPDYLAASRLGRNRLVEHGADPAEAMTDAAQWLRDAAGSHRPALVAWPLAFDWPFL